MPALSQQSKSQLRKSLRLQRRNIPTELREQHDRAIQRQLLALIKSRNARTLACFWPFDGEPDLIPACKELMQCGCEIALPVVEGESDYKMEFHLWSPDIPLTKSRYGIHEPQKSIPIPPTRFDMLLIPLVGYDKNGNRVGMGAGYYDRHLASVCDLQKPLRVGIAYQLQELEQIQQNDWDVPLHGVINEREWVPYF